MAMSVAGRGRTIAAINVTPMADIMIVLLIIFMVATPFIKAGRVRSLPAADNTAEKEDDRAVVVEITSDHATYLGPERLATAGDLLPKLQDRFGALPEDRRVVYLKAEADLPYAEVAQVMDLCREAGAEQVALVATRKVRG